MDDTVKKTDGAEAGASASQFQVTAEEARASARRADILVRAEARMASERTSVEKPPPASRGVGTRRSARSWLAENGQRL